MITDKFKKLYKSTKFDLQNLIFAGGALPDPVFVAKVSEEWQPFGDSDKNFIRSMGVPLDFDVSVFGYWAEAGMKFPKHLHSSDENLYIHGDVTFNGATFPETRIKRGFFTIPKGVVHDAYFNAKTLLILIYDPKFENDEWVGVRD